MILNFVLIYKIILQDIDNTNYDLLFTKLSPPHNYLAAQQTEALKQLLISVNCIFLINLLLKVKYSSKYCINLFLIFFI